MKVLLTGGLGYIGSHTAVQLLNAGEEVVIVDNLSNSDRKVLGRIKKTTGKTPQFYKSMCVSGLSKKEKICKIN